MGVRRGAGRGGVRAPRRGTGLIDAAAPGFIVGAPRSALSLFADVCAAHRRLGFLSQHQNWYPTDPRRSFYNRVYNLPQLGAAWYARAQAGTLRLPRFKNPVPTEPWNVWLSLLPELSPRSADGLWDPDPARGALPPGRAEQVRSAFARMARAQGRPGLVTFAGGDVRVEALRTVFPNARFVHVVRDGRAVVESWLRNIESGEFRTWEERDIWPRFWPEDWARRFRAEHHDAFGLCTYLWKHMVSSSRRRLAEFGDAAIELAYEDMLTARDATVARLLAHFGVRADRGVARYLELNPPRNNNRKWREVLGADRLARFDDIVREPELRALLRDDV